MIDGRHKHMVNHYCIRYPACGQDSVLSQVSQIHLLQTSVIITLAALWSGWRLNDINKLKTLGVVMSLAQLETRMLSVRHRVPFTASCLSCA